MIYFTKYAEEKFELLNRHKVYLRKEEVETTLLVPEKRGRIGKFLTVERKGLKVVYQKEGELNRILTFYPV